MEQHVPPNCWYLSTKLHGVISKKTLIVIVIAAETSNITKLWCFEGILAEIVTGRVKMNLPNP
jgi:hypothetical protein